MTGTYAGQFVMEGFLDFKLPIYQRVLLTRSIAIIPALIISFVNPDVLTSLDTYLNILQSVQLPFALVPVIKFVGSPQIMGDFVLPKWQIYFASTFGVFLFGMNFVIIFIEADFEDWKPIAVIVLVSIVYIGFIVQSIIEPLSPLKKMTKAEIEDHEYERIIIDNDFSESF
jgi:hypothetical protein